MLSCPRYFKMNFFDQNSAPTTYFRKFGQFCIQAVECITVITKSCGSGFLPASFSQNCSQCVSTLTPSMQNLAGSALFLPQGGTHFQLVPLGSPQGYFMGKFSPLTSIKFLHLTPPRPKVIQIIRPWKNWRDLKKLTFNTLLLH